MVLHIILADILLIARIFPRPSGARKNTTQLAKYPRVLYVKPSNKIYVLKAKKKKNKKQKQKNTGTIAKTEAGNEFEIFFFFYCFLKNLVGWRIENETFVKYGKKIPGACVDSKTGICCHSFFMSKRIK